MTHNLTSRFSGILAGMLAFALLAPSTASAQTEETINTVTESFTEESFSHPDDWEVGRLPYYSRTLPYLTAGPGGDRDGQGWLRLTNNTQHQSGYIRYKGTPIASEGLTIYAAFDFVHWDSSLSDDSSWSGPHTTVGGDGSSFFIYDADYRDNFHPGAKGGSLGYAQISGMDGGDYNAPVSGVTAVANGAHMVDLYWTDNTMVEENFIVQCSTSSSFTTYREYTVPNNCTHFTDDLDGAGLAASTTYYYRVRANGAQLSSGDQAFVSTSAVTGSGTVSAASSGYANSVTYVVRVRATWYKQNPSHSYTVTLNAGGSSQTWSLPNRSGTSTNDFIVTSSSSFNLKSISLTLTNPRTTKSSSYYIGVDYIMVYPQGNSNTNYYQAENCTNITSPQGAESGGYSYLYYGTGTINYSTYTGSDVTFPTGSMPAAPTAITASASGTNIVVGWTDNSTDEDSFSIEYLNGAIDTTWSTLVSGISAHSGTGAMSYTLSQAANALSAGVQYTFRVRAYKSDGSYSPTTTSASATMTASGGTGTAITLRALTTSAGTTAIIQTDVDGDGTYTNAATFLLDTVFSEFTYSPTEEVPIGAIRVYSSSSPGDVLVDWIKVGEDTYQAENCIYNSGNTTSIGNFRSFSEWLVNAGYIDFGEYSTGNPVDALGGVSGGYIGIGMDDWGNYSWEGDYGGTSNEGRVGHSDNNAWPAYPGYSRHAIAVRGDEASGYNYLVGTGDLNVADLERSMNFPAATERPTLRPDLRRLSMIITPDNQLTVFIKYGTGDTEALFTADLSPGSGMGSVRPKNILFGFASSSGGATNYHEIRNVVVTTFKSLIWDGEVGDREWTTPKNWLFDQTPEASGYEDVEFESPVRRATTMTFEGQTGGVDFENVHLSSPVSIHTITISANDIIYKLWGEPITLNATTEGASLNVTGGNHIIESQIVAEEEFNLNATLGSTMLVTGNIDNSSYQMRLTGKGEITMNNVISGEGGLRIEDDGTYVFTGDVDNSYDGVNTMQEGTLRLNKLGDLQDGSGKYIFRKATGLGPIIMSCVEACTTTNVYTRLTSRIYLDNHNQIDNNTDVNLDGGEIHLNGWHESGDDLR